MNTISWFYKYPDKFLEDYLDISLPIYQRIFIRKYFNDRRRIMGSHLFYTEPFKIAIIESLPKIKNVIFNNPATIVFWEDGTKTIVKAQKGDIFDKEKGLAMAITKKAMGNKGNFNEVFKKWCD